MAQVQFAHGVTQQHTSYNRSTRGTQAASQRDGVVDMHMGFHGEGSLVMASQDVESDAGEKVGGGVEGHFARLSALALVGDFAVQGFLRGGLGPVNGDGQLEVDGQGQSNDVEARADVG